MSVPSEASAGARSTSLLPIADWRQSRRHLARILRPQAGRLILTTVLLLAGSAAALAIPPFLGSIVDVVITRGSGWLIAAYAGAIGTAGVVSAVLLRWAGGVMVSCLQRALAALREDVFTAALALDSATVEDAGTSDVVSRVTGDVEAITAAVSTVLPRFVQATFTVGLTMIGLAALHPLLAAAALVAVPIQVIATTRFLRRSRPLYRRLRHEEAIRGQAIIESVRGSDTVIAHREQTHHLQQLAERSLTAVETQRDATRARNRFNAGLNLAEFLGLATVLGVGFWLTLDTDVTVGTVTAAALFVHRLFDPIGALLASIDDLQRAAAGLGRLVGVVLVRPAKAVRVEIADASVTVDAVSHRYLPGGHDAVTDVSLNLRPGSTTVFVGASGSGKSTMAQLIAGVLTPTIGRVTVGGVPASAAGAPVRRAVLLVAQETHLFTGTLAENLRLANASATDAELWAALDEVAATWTHGLPEGLHTVLTHDLDEARVQQLALARVLLSDPPVVVLDEATAHAGTDGLLDRAMEVVTADRTAVVVAHRFVQAELADLIVVFEGGQVVEQGTHRELLAADGTYARLHAASTVRAGAA